MKAKLFRLAFTKDFSEISMKDVAKVGGKNASLGEMFRNLRSQGINVPDGFAVTSFAYWRFIDSAGLRPMIKKILRGLDVKDIRDLESRGAAVRQAIMSAELPLDVAEAALRAFRRLRARSRREIEVAVRSSATAEDLPGASFAGQQESYLNVRGEKELLLAVKKCYASLFTNRAIVYREEKGFNHLRIALSVGVQVMIRSDLAAAGVMFTLDTETGFRDAVLVNAAYGLGESVVQGRVMPDQFYVYKPFLKNNLRPLIGRRLGEKEIKVVYAKGGALTKTAPVSPGERRHYCLTDDEVLLLAKWGAQIEKYYSKISGEYRPMDIEWAKDGRTSELFIVQARPETVQAKRDQNVLLEYLLKKKGKVLTSGLAIGSKIGTGRVRVIKNMSEMHKFRDGEILVAEMTDPDWVPIMKRAAAIVTSSGGRTCHAAIVSRELGTPAVVGTGNAARALKTGMPVTVSCAEGENGFVYQGILPYEIRKTKLATLGKPKTDIMMNLAEPSQAFEYSFLPGSGVGLARVEFIFNDFVKAHPLALINYRRLKDKKARREIDKLTSGYSDKRQYFIDRMAEGIAMLAAAFYPKDVIVRVSDFKTNEYAKLIGGEAFEPKEANPMIGWRGASRYYDKNYKDAFLLECAALRKVREKMGFKNVVVMIPFCRTPEEGRAVLKVMSSAGLRRGKDGLRVFVMVEIPSNVILAEEFADLFDGFSIGSNDLTQLTLGVDRDSALVSHLYNELNPAVRESVSRVIRVARKKKIKVGICGQAPSDFPEFAEFVVREGIDSVSLNPDTVLKTTLNILKLEKKLRRR
jgi:pyruvate,water dikinase